MGIEIKGLGDSVQRAKGAIGLARAAADRMNASVAGLVKTANEIADSCDKHRADLEFEATQLGNSPPSSSAPDSSFRGQIDLPGTARKAEGT